jgi:hypothetical protein
MAFVLAPWPGVSGGRFSHPTPFTRPSSGANGPNGTFGQIRRSISYARCRILNRTSHAGPIFWRAGARPAKVQTRQGRRAAE